MLDSRPLSASIRIGHDTLSEGSGGVFVHHDPVSGIPQGTIPLAGAVEVGKAVDRAVQAAEAWRFTNPDERRQILLRFAQLIWDHVEEFARLAARDGGTPLAHGRRMAQRAGDWFATYAGWADKIDGQLISTHHTRGHLSYSSPEPIGIVGIIITWNGPLISLGMKVAPALAAGNCVVVKPAENTPFAPDLFASLARDAGIPDGVLSILPGGIEAGEALVRDPRVEKISFTGGPVAAKKILVACAEQLKPAVLELGGKSASLVYPDVDIDAVCQRAAAWTFAILAGQGCALPTRLIVHRSIYDLVIERMIEITKSYKVGDPFDEDVKVGPLVSAQACDRVMTMLDRVREGNTGRIVLGGKRCGGDLAGGNFIEPTIIVDVDPDSEIAQTEIFGPVVICMPFDDDDHGVELANRTPYGLAAYIQSNDIARVHRIAERLKAGGVYVNGAPQTAPYMPFGGLGLSGYGKEGGRAGLDEFLRYKTVVVA
ncbi:aldehyde dehydrogenase family protein [Novosphingobium sp. BL-52-GroH]|uniref:aldehyde dehydrogenase family protein n=1 Tax=Novosphingobium sp. BL-52-GroH TaxID=3349877 RepID=UPI00384BDA3C